MKSAFRILVATAILWTWNITPAARAQSTPAPTLTQAPVPANTAPLPSKDQPYVYKIPGTKFRGQATQPRNCECSKNVHN